MEKEQLLSAVTQLLEEQKRYAEQQEKINAALQNIDAHICALERPLKTVNGFPSDSRMEKLQEDIVQIKTNYLKCLKTWCNKNDTCFFLSTMQKNITQWC